MEDPAVIDYWPLMILLIGIAAVVIQIAVLRIPAFFSLVISAVLVGILCPELPVEGANHLVNAVELVMVELGITAGKIAMVIALASVLGIAMTESGAAERIVVRFVRIFGEKLAPIALLLGGFVLAIPVFFDTVFFLLIPIAYSMGRRLQQNYVLYILAVCIGGVLTHSVVPPTPGPLIMAETLEINLGIVIVAGILACIIPAIVGYRYALYLNKKLQVSFPQLDLLRPPSEDDINQLPAFSLSILPIVIPLLLIVVASVLNVFVKPGASAATTVINFLGNKNVAMFIGMGLALWILARQKGWRFKQLAQVIERPLEIAGLIILITSAGGAFGAMIRHTGIGEMIGDMAAAGYSINFVLLAWLISAVLKTAQGSTTVAVIAASGIMFALISEAGALPYHPIYIYLAIGFGGLFVSWMNDSGFWVVSKLSGLTEKETLQTLTTTLAVLALVGLVEVFLLSYVLPLI